MPKRKSMSETIGAGPTALHVSFTFITKNASAKHGTYMCTVTCERWQSILPKGRLRRSTGISAETKHVHPATHRILEKAIYASEVRSAIASVRQRIQDIASNHRINPGDPNDAPSMEKVSEAIRTSGVDISDDNMLITRTISRRGARGAEYGGLMGRYLSEYVARDGRKFADSKTMKGNTCTMALHLYQFSADCFGGKLTLNDLTIPTKAQVVVRTFKKYLAETCDLLDPTIENILKRLRTFLAWTEREGLVWKLDLTPYRFSVKRQPKVTLTIEELGKVITYKFGPDQERYERARDLWLLQCFTALRYSDVAQMSIPDIRQKMFSVATQKTKVLANIPVFDIMKDLVEKYPDRLPTMSNQECNRTIKLAFEVIGITREVVVPYTQGGKEMMRTSRVCDEIATHSARRQFVSMAQQFSVPRSMIQVVTGHRNIEELLTYTHHPGEEISESFERMNAALPRMSK
ncbi:MAG: hypothetical protein SGJ05_01750 [bacterium]|nr:hypothetical protein [bacterium]